MSQVDDTVPILKLIAKSLENSVICLQLHQLEHNNLENFPLPLESVCNQLNGLAQYALNKKNTSLENETK